VRREKSLISPATIRYAKCGESHSAKLSNTFRQICLTLSAFIPLGQVLDIAIRSAKVKGHFLEFGVYRGGTISYIARMRPDVTIHGFDSFEGLSHEWKGYTLDKGAFALGGRLPRVPRNVQLYKGWFDNTLPKWIIAIQGPVSFVHIDCDLYSSTKTVFEHLAPRIVGGTVIAFDEYFGYPNWKQHEIKAFKELVADRGLSYEYLAYAKTQVALKISHVPQTLTG